MSDTTEFIENFKQAKPQIFPFLINTSSEELQGIDKLGGEKRGNGKKTTKTQNKQFQSV